MQWWIIFVFDGKRWNTYHTRTQTLSALLMLSKLKVVYSMYIIEWGNWKLFSVYFITSYLTTTTQPIGTLNIWRCVLTLLVIKTHDFRLPSLLVFSTAQTWEAATSEMRWLGFIMDLKLISLFPFFADAFSGHMNMIT